MVRACTIRCRDLRTTDPTLLRGNIEGQQGFERTVAGDDTVQVLDLSIERIPERIILISIGGNCGRLGRPRAQNIR